MKHMLVMKFDRDDEGEETIDGFIQPVGGWWSHQVNDRFEYILRHVMPGCYSGSMMEMLEAMEELQWCIVDPETDSYYPNDEHTQRVFIEQFKDIIEDAKKEVTQ